MKASETDRDRAVKTIKACKLTHQLWIDYWSWHANGCNCGVDHAAQEVLVGSKAHHEDINAEYDNVLSVLTAAETFTHPTTPTAADKATGDKPAPMEGQ